MLYIINLTSMKFSKFYIYVDIKCICCNRKYSYKILLYDRIERNEKDIDLK